MAMYLICENVFHAIFYAKYTFQLMPIYHSHIADARSILMAFELFISTGSRESKIFTMVLLITSISNLNHFQQLRCGDVQFVTATGKFAYRWKQRIA